MYSGSPKSEVKRLHFGLLMACHRFALRAIMAVRGPFRARIWRVTTEGIHFGPKTTGTRTGAVTTIPIVTGKHTTATVRTPRRNPARSRRMSSCTFEKAGKATLPSTSEIFWTGSTMTRKARP